MVHLTVRRPCGDELAMEVAATDAVREVKRHLAAKWGLAPICQELVVGSEVLEDHHDFSGRGDALELLLICSLRDLCAGLGSATSLARSAALKELAGLRGHAGAVEAALRCLEDSNAHVRDRAVAGILGIAEAGDPVVLEMAQRMLQKPETAELGLRLLAGVAPRGHEPSLSCLWQFTSSREQALRRACAEAMGRVALPGMQEAREALVLLLRDPDREGFVNVRIAALRALADLGAADEEALSAVAACLRDGNGHTRKAAEETALALVGAGSRRRLLGVVLSHLQEVRKDKWRESLTLLGKLAEEAGEEDVNAIAAALAPLLQDLDPELQLTSARLLLRLLPLNSASTVLEAQLASAEFLERVQALEEVERGVGSWLQGSTLNPET